ncbi:neprilysin-21-like [Musca autumnalis]|uniref:neprilysin-21-like n=1 Tax=Musca autumnalis TaxID=221902 RepID=UPI003CEDAF94
MWKTISVSLVMCILQLSQTTNSTPTNFPGSNENSAIKQRAYRQNKFQEIGKFMNITADPCDNFYKFACGNWRHYHPANADETQRDALTEAHKEFLYNLENILTPKDFGDFSEPEIKLKNLYDSCLSLQQLQQREYNAKLNELAKEFGGMPLLEGDGWREQQFDWQKTIAQISHKYGLNIIVGFEIAPLNQSQNEIYFRPQDFPIQNDFLEHRDVYRGEVLELLKTHFNLDEVKALEVAQGLVEFELKLWKAKVEDANAPSNPISIDELQTKFSLDLDVYQFMEITYGSIPHSLQADITVYLEKVIDIIKSTPKQLVANYIFYNLQKHFQFKIPNDHNKLKSECLIKIEQLLPKVISHLYYRKYKLERYKKPLYEMWNSIKATIQKALESPKMFWNDNEFRNFSLAKLQSLEMVIASYQENNFTTEYQTLTISPHDFVENLKSLLSFKAYQTRQTLHQKPELVEFGLDMFLPSYVPTANKVIVPVSILGDNFIWSEYNSHNLNYAHLGFTLAHEMMHAFNGAARYYDYLGRLITNTWDIEEEFVQHEECLYNQYHNYTFGGRHLPQDKMQEENAADNEGILITLESYRNWLGNAARSDVEDQLSLEMIPDLSYNPEQVFFIYYAQLWCSDTFNANTLVKAATDVHVPDEFRAYVPLTNLPQFSKAFKCHKDTAMNPSVKCKQLFLL